MKNRNRLGCSVILVCLVSLLVILTISCNPNDPLNPGTFTFNITGADDFNGNNFYYKVDSFLPAERAMADAISIDGFEQVVGGVVHITLEDPASSGTDYLFKANNVMSVYAFLDSDGNGENHGGIDYEMNDLSTKLSSAHINGDMTLNMAYPADFHLSQSGSAALLLKKNSGLMVFRDDDNDMGTVSVGSAVDFTFRIENTGGALLTLEGTPLVALSGTDSAHFSVQTQPASTEIVPTDEVTFVLRVTAPSAGTTYSVTLTIPFDDTNNDDPNESSPYVTTISVTTP